MLLPQLSNIVLIFFRSVWVKLSVHAHTVMPRPTVAAITAGLARSVLVFRSLNGRSGPRYGRSGGARRPVGGNGSMDEFTGRK